MLKPGRKLNLAKKPVGSLDASQLGAEDLDGDEAIVPEIAGEIDPGHPTVAQLPQDGIAVTQA
jgi:hypothetical protein